VYTGYLPHLPDFLLDQQTSTQYLQFPRNLIPSLLTHVNPDSTDSRKKANQFG